MIHKNPFATLVFKSGDDIQSFHLPLIMKNNSLIGHMAKANPAWQALDGSSVLVIFHGPHCYISPDYYGKPGNVPTWNDISIQVRGDVKIKTDLAFLATALIELGQQQDSSWRKASLRTKERTSSGILKAHLLQNNLRFL